MPPRKAQGLPAATLPTIHNEQAKKVARRRAGNRATLIACQVAGKDRRVVRPPVDASQAMPIIRPAAGREAVVVTIWPMTWIKALKRDAKAGTTAAAEDVRPNAA